jgi:TolB protein
MRPSHFVSISILTVALSLLPGCVNLPGKPAGPTQPAGAAAQPAALPKSTSQTPLPAATETNPAIFAHAAPIPSCKRIAFVMVDRSQKDPQEIYSICPDGTGLIRLTNSPAAESSPAWSPNSQKIAYESTGQIYIMDADGSHSTQLTKDLVNSKPIWMPGGQRIAFETTNGAGLWWWRSIKIDGSDVQTLTKTSYDFFFQTLAWSPDGSKIAYMSLKEQEVRNDGSSQIHVCNLDGTGDRALTQDIWANIKPLWSPDGKKLAFFSERDGTYNVFALYIINIDGSGLRRLTKPQYDESASFSWSSDGRKIAIYGISNQQINIINIADGQITPLPGLKNFDVVSSPSWQP